MDSQQLSSCIDSAMQMVEVMNEIIALPGEFNDESFQQQLFKDVMKLTMIVNFIPNESAFEQMQFTNTLRLIRFQDVIDSILRYHTANIQLKEQQDFVEKYFNARTDLLLQIIDLRKMPDLKYNGNKEAMQLLWKILWLNPWFGDYICTRWKSSGTWLHAVLNL